jgi:hypothetical protein
MPKFSYAIVQFLGRIYAKGKAEDPECTKDDFARLHTKKPRFDLPLGQCGMKSLRSVSFIARNQ